MRKLLNIGELANLFKIETSKIRYYEKEGLLRSQRDIKSGYRLYGFQEIARLETIILFRELGVSLNTLKKLIEDYNLKNYKNLLDKLLIETDQEIAKIKNKKKQLEKSRNFIENFTANTFHIISKKERKIFIDNTIKNNFKNPKEFYDYHEQENYNFRDYNIEIYSFLEENSLFWAFSKPRKKPKELILPQGNYISIYKEVKESSNLQDLMTNIKREIENLNYITEGNLFAKIDFDTLIIENKEYMLFEIKQK